ncbi:hypothetical protein GCM10027361_01010 [Erwinia aphidicola]|uniref:phage head-binding domain-containing protein n=1 Tax=Erwinia aphidicola TaxID=68334 RepID=UPI001745E591|nr:phage head-binding domain-containing protein [Erwinia aphidicola]MBD1377186.1 hypothetical protein [Erwinia aphidicola]
MPEITANVVVSMPNQLFTQARAFKSVTNGSVYIGKIDTDPTIPANQIQVYIENETGGYTPVSQPLSINSGGYPVYNGQITKFVTVEGHSMAVYDSYGAQQFYFPNVLGYDPDQLEKRLPEMLAEYELAEFKRKYSFAAGGTAQTSQDAFIDVSGNWWFYTGTFPFAVPPDTDPTLDSLWYCAGLLNGKEINNLSSWCDTTQNIDRTITLKRFFRTVGLLKMKAFGSGVVTVSSAIEIPNVEFDFSDLTIYIDPNSDNTVSGSSGRLFTITDPDSVVYTGQSFSTSNVGQLATIQLSGPNFRNRSVGIEAETPNDNAYLRLGSNYIKKADIYVMDDSGTGFHGATPALFKYNDTAKLTARPIRNQHINRPPKFILSQPLSSNRKLRTCIRIERNSVTIIGGCMNAQAAGLYVESMFELNSVINCEFRDVQMLNQNDNIDNNGNYVINAYCVLDLKVVNCRCLNGWSLVDGNFMRNTVVMDCEAAAVGCHAMAWNFHVERCRFFATLVQGEYQGGIGLTGGGKLTVRNIHYIYRGGPRAKDHPIATRGDYGQAWEGEIDVEGLEVLYSAPVSSGNGMAMIYMIGADIGSIDLTRDCYLGKRISMRNLKVYVPNAAWTVDQVVVNPVFFQTTFTQNVRYPTDYIVEDLYLDTSGPGWALDPRWPVLGTNTNIVQGMTRSIMRRCRASNTANMFVISATAADITAGNYRITADITLEDINGGVSGIVTLPPSNRFTVRRSVINKLQIGGISNSAGTIKVERCDIGGTPCGGSTGNDVCYFYENHIITNASIAVGSLAKYCHGNTVQAGGAISGRTVDEWYNYRDTSVFRTT